MKYKITTIIALLAVMFALTGIASAFDVEFLKQDGTKTNPIFIRNGESFILDMRINNLRVQDINKESPMTKVYLDCANASFEVGVNCAESDITLNLLKDFFNVTAVPSTFQPGSVFVAMNAPPEREPGTQYSFVVFVGPFGDPQETASVSLTVVLEGANITGMKFNDINGDGIKGALEPGLSGWTIILKNKDTGATVATTVTDSSGNYNFSNLRGNFTVEEVLQSGWNQTFPAGKTYNVTVDGEDINDLDFGNVALVAIYGKKFNDLNHNGVNNGEPGLAGWTIILKNKDTGATVATTVTDSSGNYNFSNLLPGNYTIDEVQKAGWIQSAPTPVPPGNYSVTLAGTSVTDRDFGNYQPLANISGNKFNDLNQNHVNDSEPALQGWTITLKNGSGAIVATTMTDINGNYKFTNLPPDTYTISETQQGGWTQTAPMPVPPGTHTVVLNGVDVTGKDFGNFKVQPTPTPQPGPGKVIGWGNLGSSAMFNIWVYSNFLPNGKMEFTDKINNIVIKATSFDSVMTDVTATPKTGTITGMATVNGAGPYPFTVKVVDAADPGAGKDMFTIDVSSPTPYHNSGTLTIGDLTVVK